jgi:hypothetical protein
LPPVFSATRALPESSSESAASTASRTGPVVAALTPSRASQAALMMVSSWLGLI